jgi:hypothetical protein
MLRDLTAVKRGNIMSMYRYGKNIVLPLIGAAASVLAGAVAAHAGGGFSAPSISDGGSAYESKAGTGETTASSTGGVVYTSPNVDYSSTATASAQTSVTDSGLNASVLVGGSAKVDLNKAGTVTQSSTSTSTSFSKNGGSIAKGRSDTVTTVVIGGKTYMVVEDVARAAARATPFGSSSATSAEQNVSVDGSGYSAATTNTDKTSRGAR